MTIFFHKLRFCLLKAKDAYIFWKQKHSSVAESEAYVVDLPSNTIDEHRRYWNIYNWSSGGEEWTEHAQKYKGLNPEHWKASLISGMIHKYFKTNGVILEIGSGAGRWSIELIKLADRVILADISEKCLDICKEKFKRYDKVEYKLVTNFLDFLGESSVDYVWSYDVFVHINPTDIKKYVSEFQRILKPGGIAIIHHAGNRTLNTLNTLTTLNPRSMMDGSTFASIVHKNGMEIIDQNNTLHHRPGDLLSVFRNPF
jgi:SAM-dependent methyltransferase